MRQLDRTAVKILPGLFAERMRLNREYLKELDTRCLLQNYYLEAGEIMDGIQVIDDPAGARLHWGWEAPTCQLRGHFLGHYLSAMAAVAVSEGDREAELRVEYIVSELRRLQKLNGGCWVAPIPEKYFDILMTDRYIWSPQYTMHKLIMGLTDVLSLMGNKTAGEILSGLADWYLSWTDKAKEKCPRAVYAGEQAGMLEIWARLYELTEDGRYLELVKRYENNSIFEVLDRGGDPITDNHANASIPLAHGAAKLYELTGDEKWRERVETFWKKAVTERGMLATTGANSGEFWIPANRMGEFISATDQEFCTVYNMVRLAEFCYKWTGESLYADYIEKAIYNGFLAQQSRVSGMPTYFLPMTAGSRKKWGTRTRDFWCCFGTMVQAQTLYPELIYLADDENKRLLVSQYIPSEVSCEVGGINIKLSQTTDMKNYSNQAFFDERGGGALSRWSLRFEADSGGNEVTLSFRLPKWSEGRPPKLFINGADVKESGVSVDTVDGYINLRAAFSGDEIRLIFEPEPVFEFLPDIEDRAAISVGPVVLAGLTDKDRTLKARDAAGLLKRRMTHTYSTFPWEQDHYITTGQDENISFIPLYEVEDEAYTIYFSIR